VISKGAKRIAPFRDILAFTSVDAGRGWLVLLCPGQKLPSGSDSLHELYFLCNDLTAEIASVASKDVACSEVQEAHGGAITKMRLPGGGEIGLYQPKHPTALGLTLK